MGAPGTAIAERVKDELRRRRRSLRGGVGGWGGHSRLRRFSRRGGGGGGEGVEAMEERRRRRRKKKRRKSHSVDRAQGLAPGDVPKIESERSPDLEIFFVVYSASSRLGEHVMITNKITYYLSSICPKDGRGKHRSEDV